MSNANLPIELLENENATKLELDPKHPGLNDSTYVKRRQQLFDLARQYRINNQGFPRVDYTPQEHQLWHTITEKLAPLHQQKATKLYLDGLTALNIETHSMPQLADLSNQLREKCNIGLVPAEGLLSTRSFYAYLSNRRMPCTLFLRHTSHPEYTPEPDAVHDLIGHVPMLTDPTYADLIELIGQGVKHANNTELSYWSRVYWFTIEFSLIEEKNDLKIFGAGLLSSFGEMEYAYSDQVQRKPFNIEEVIHTDYDNTKMQDILFVIPSVQILKEEIVKLLDKLC
jgi:monomeric phenylalanine-4-hydroxylase